MLRRLDFALLPHQMLLFVEKSRLGLNDIYGAHYDEEMCRMSVVCNLAQGVDDVMWVLSERTSYTVAIDALSVYLNSKNTRTHAFILFTWLSRRIEGYKQQTCNDLTWCPPAQRIRSGNEVFLDALYLHSRTCL